MSLGKALESNVVSVEVGIHGVVHIGNVVFHTVIDKFNQSSQCFKKKLKIYDTKNMLHSLDLLVNRSFTLILVVLTSQRNFRSYGNSKDILLDLLKWFENNGCGCRIGLR